MNINDRRLEQSLMLSTVLLAFLVVFARAILQSITIDEADSYLVWCARSSPSHWIPASNNHVLNSILVRLFTSVLGPAHLTIRAPALIGAAFYILAALGFCRLLGGSFLLRWSVFVCLVYNPFVLDYLVAARGYSMALGFLLCALVTAASWQLTEARERPVIRACAVCSVCLALSFASNFSFAFIDSAALLAILFLAWRNRKMCDSSVSGFVRLLTACVLPGLVVTLFLSASVVLAWPKGQLWYGANSIRQTLRSVIEASLYEVNPHVANPIVYEAGRYLKQYLFPALGLALLCQVLLIAFSRDWRGKVVARRRVELGIVFIGITLLAVLVHWLSFRLFHLLLPMDRTAIYLVVFWILIAGIAAAVPFPWSLARVVRGGLTAVLLVLSIYFLMCLRLTHFREWKWNADAKDIYSVLAYYNHKFGIREVTTSWRFTSVLNFYRTLSGSETFKEFVAIDKYPSGKKLYVLLYPFDSDFVANNRLKVVYHGETSDAVVAVSPEVESGTTYESAVSASGS